MFYIIQSRDSELTEAIEEMAANPPSSEMQEIVKELEDEKEKLKKENKDLKNQIKKFKRAKTGQGAIEVVPITLLSMQRFTENDLLFYFNKTHL